MHVYEENPLTYLTGDATRPVGKGIKIIAHVCHNLGQWGKGWERVEPLIQPKLCQRDVAVYVYDLIENITDGD